MISVTSSGDYGSYELSTLSGVVLEAGTAIIRLEMVSANFNFDQIEFNQSSGARSVISNSEILSQNLIVYPNPVIDQASNVFGDHIKLNESVLVLIYNMQSKLVFKEAYAQDDHISANLNDIPNGMYLLKILSGNFEHTERIQVK